MRLDGYLNDNLNEEDEIADKGRLDEYLDNLKEGTGSQISHANKQTSKSEGGETSRSIKKLITHFNTVMGSMDKDGYGMESLRVAVQFEDMIRMMSNIYGNAQDLLELPDRRYMPKPKK